MHSRKARAIAQMRENYPALRRAWIEAAELFHQIGIGEAVKAVALDTFGGVAARNRKQLRDVQHVAMKRGVEAGHLKQSGMALAQSLDQFNLAREVIGVVRGDFAQ